MMRPLTIAACLALTTAVAFADEPKQDPGHHRGYARHRRRYHGCRQGQCRHAASS